MSIQIKIKRPSPNPDRNKYALLLPGKKTIYIPSEFPYMQSIRETNQTHKFHTETESCIEAFNQLPIDVTYFPLYFYIVPTN